MRERLASYGILGLGPSLARDIRERSSTGHSLASQEGSLT